MLIPLLSLIAALGIAASAGTARAIARREEEPGPKPKKKVTRIRRKPTPKKVVKKKVPSKVKIEVPKKKPKKKKVKAKRPPTKKEKKAAQKIKALPKSKAKKVLKKLEDVVKKPKKGKKPVHPIVKQEAKKKIKKVKGPNLADIAKFFRAKATKNFPWVWRNPKNGQKVWSNKKGFEQLNRVKTHKFIKFNPNLATKKQKTWWANVLKALAGPPKPVPAGKPKPLPAPAKREIIKKVVKAEETTKPTPEEAARALAIYTKEGGWQGTKDRPSLVVRKAQLHMGVPDAQADGIIGPGTRALAKKYGALLYTRSSQAKGAYHTAETF